MRSTPAHDVRMPNEATHLFFFFSSRRRHTRLQGDWSSDVCSSDLMPVIDCPGVGLPSTDFGITKVIVPSALALLAGSRLPIVVNTRAAPWGTPVLP